MRLSTRRKAPSLSHACFAALARRDKKSDADAEGAQQRTAREAANESEAHYNLAQAQAYAQLDTFPELRSALDQAVPADLLPIWCGDRQLDQYEGPGGGSFDLTTCRLRTDHAANHPVYEALFRGQRVALKEYRTDAPSLKRCYAEAMVLRRLKHPGVVEIQAVFATNGSLYIQMPFYEQGTLRQWYDRRAPSNEAFASVLLLVLEACVHLHSYSLVHLDIKPENILLDGQGRPHLADYDISHDGATRAATHARAASMLTRMGTDGFIAPEIEAGEPATTKADMFSLGRAVEAVVPDDPLRRSDALRDLLQGLVRTDPQQRLSAEGAVRHPYFAPLLAGRYEGSRECVICTDTLLLSEGLCCQPIQLGADSHFTCRSCLDHHVRHATLGGSLVDEDDEAERSRMRRQRQQLQGRICCPKHPRECDAPPLADSELARNLPEATFARYMASRAELTEQRLEQEANERMQELLAQELERLSQMDELQRKVSKAKSDIGDRLNRKCPHCSQVFYDFSGCCALACNKCSCHFCAWCLAPSADSRANHLHVASCRHKPAGSDAYYASQEVWRAFWREKDSCTVRKMLAELPGDIARDVFDAMHGELDGLDVARPGGPPADGGQQDVEMGE